MTLKSEHDASLVSFDEGVEIRRTLSGTRKVHRRQSADVQKGAPGWTEVADGNKSGGVDATAVSLWSCVSHPD